MFKTYNKSVLKGAISSTAILTSIKDVFSGRVLKSRNSMKPDDYSLSITTAAPTTEQRCVAIATAVVLAVAFVAMAPFASVLLPKIDGFIPAVQAIVFIADLTTAGLLLSCSAAEPSRPIIVLAGGYFFSSIIAVAYALATPGAFVPGGLGNSSGQSSAWLFTFWIAGFCISVLWYAWLKLRGAHAETASPPSSRPIASRSFAMAVVIALAGIVLCAVYTGDGRWPILVLTDGSTVSPLWYGISGVMLLSCGIALVLLARSPVSVLDMWLMVGVFSMILELARVTLLVSKRFTVGFYFSRAFLVAVATAVLVALLWEFGRLHGNLMRAHRLLVAERENKLLNIEAAVAAIAHQLRQPIMGIVSQAAAGRRFLRREPPDSDRVERAFDRIEKAGFHADNALEGVRALFKSSNADRQMVDMNDVILNVLQMFNKEIEAGDIRINAQLRSSLPAVTGHTAQLREVFVNLVQNAIEAMAAVDREARILAISTERNRPDGIVVSVSDSGPGIAAGQATQIFNPFVTTKPHGMGFGLAFCKMVVEQSGGDISVSSGVGGGACFRIVLPG